MSQCHHTACDALSGPPAALDPSYITATSLNQCLIAAAGPLLGLVTLYHSPVEKAGSAHGEAALALSPARMGANTNCIKKWLAVGAHQQIKQSHTCNSPGFFL